MFWLCIDHGHKRLGVAGGDTREGIASPLKTVSARPEEAAMREISRLAQEYDAAGIVVGLPINMDDTEGPQAVAARDFAAALAQHTALDVRMWDERLSSFAADGRLAGQLTRAKKRAVQDAVAAAEILQDFLACDGPDAAPVP